MVQLLHRGSMIFLLKKLSYLFFMLFLISLITFGVIHLAPNALMGGGALNPNMTPEALEQLRTIYGLDAPLYLQYIHWLYNIFTFNFGISYVSGEAVIDAIGKHIGVTLVMNTIALVIVFFVSITLGVVAAFKTNDVVERVINQLALISFSMPSYYLALLLLLFFSVWWQWFPLTGLHSVGKEEGMAYYVDALWHLTLPIIVMVFVSIGSLTLYIRALSLEILKSDYIFFAKARAIPTWKMIRYYLLPNLLPPIVTLLGLSLPGLIGGSIILEAIFGIDGMGRLFYLSAMSRDYPVILGILIISAFLTLLGNMVADAILLVLNPFVRQRS